MKIKKITLICLVIYLAVSYYCAYPQDLSLFGGAKSSKQRDNLAPTEISSDTMDIKTSENIAIFTGNVLVKDQEMKIKCHKMILYLEDNNDTGNPEKSSQKKRIKKIVFEGDVDIQRELKEDGKKKIQLARAGLVEYDLKDQKITMTEKPYLEQDGKDKVENAKTIRLWRDSERVAIEGGTIKLSPDTMKTNE